MTDSKKSVTREGAISRRQFIAGAAVAAPFMIVPRHAIAGSGQTPPSEKLNIACIGVCGRGSWKTA